MRLLEAYRYCPYCGAAFTSAIRIGAPPVGLRCVACGEEVYANPLPTAAAVIVRRGLVLLGKRAVEPYTGMYSLPGGFLEEGETAEQALARELHEETGMTLQKADLLGLYVDPYPYRGVVRWCLCAAFLVEARGDAIAGSDVAAAEWWPLATLPDAIAFAGNRNALAEARLRLSGRLQRR